VADAPLSFSVNTDEIVKSKEAVDALTDSTLKLADAVDKQDQSQSKVSQKRRSQYDDTFAQGSRAKVLIESQSKGEEVLAKAVEQTTIRLREQTNVAGAVRAAHQQLAQATRQNVTELVEQERVKLRISNVDRAIVNSLIGGGGMDTALRRVATSMALNTAASAAMIGGWAAVAVAGTAAVAGYLYLGKAIAELTEAQQLQERRIQSFVGSGQQAVVVYKDIARYAYETGQSIDAASAKFVNFYKATAGMGVMASGALGVSSTTDKIASLSGATDAERGAASGALAKMLAQSTVSAADLKSVLDSVPAIADNIARGMGLTVQQLRLMAVEGRLTNEQVFAAMLKQQKEINDEAAKMPRTISGSFQQIGNDLQQIIVRYSQLLPMAAQFKLLLEGTRIAAAELNKATTPATPEQKNDSLLRDIGASSRLGALNPLYNNNRYSREYFSNQFDAGVQANGQITEQIRRQTEALQQQVVAAIEVARTYDKLAGSSQKYTTEIAMMEKAIEGLASGFSGLPVDEATSKIEQLTEAIRLARQEASQLATPYGKALESMGTLYDQNRRGLTPAQAAYEGRVAEHMKGGAPNEDAAKRLADAESIEQLKQLLDKKAMQVDMEERVTASMKKGAAATRAAQVELAVMNLVLSQVGVSSEAAQVQFDALMEKFRSLETRSVETTSARGGINASKQYLDELAGIAAQMKVVEQGAYAMRRAEAEARASRSDDGTGKLQLEAFDAKQGLTDANTIANLKQEIELTNKLAAAAGDVAKQKKLQLEYDITRAQKDAAPASRPAIAAEMTARATAETNRQLAEGVAQMEKQLELGQQELGVITEGAAGYAAQIAMLQKKRDLQQQGIDVENDANARRQVELAGQLAALEQQKGLARQAADEQKRIWQGVADNIQKAGSDAFFELFQGQVPNAQQFANTLKNIFLRAFADIAAAAIIRPIIAPIFQGAAGMGLISPQAAISANGGYGGGTGGTGGASGLGGFQMPNMGIGSGMFGFLNRPIMPQTIDAQIANWSTYGTSAQNSLNGGFLSNTTWGQGLGALAGAGMGVYNLATANGNTGKTIGGIASLVGAGVSLIPGIGQVAGPLIGMLGGLLPGLFGEEQPKLPPISGANASFNWNPQTGKYSTSTSTMNGGQDISGQYKGAVNSIQELYKLVGGITDPSKVYGFSVWNNERDKTGSTYLTGPDGFSQKWGQGSTPKDIGAETVAAQAAYLTILEATKISDNMRTALDRLGKEARDSNTPIESVGAVAEVVQSVKAFDDAIKGIGKSSNIAEEALKAIDDKFVALYDTAKKYGFDATGLDAEKARQRFGVAEDFTKGLDRQLMTAADAALFDIAEERKQANEINDVLKNADISGFVDQALKIEQIYQRKRLAILEEGNRATADAQKAAVDAATRAAEVAANRVRGIEQLIKELTYSQQSPATSIEIAQGEYNAMLARAQKGDERAIADISSVGSEYNNMLRAGLGSTPGYFREIERMRTELRDLVVRFGAPAGSTSVITEASDSNLRRMLEASLASQDALARKLDKVMSTLVGVVGESARAALYS
jgi:tape measure domain-containing protein